MLPILSTVKDVIKLSISQEDGKTFSIDCSGISGGSFNRFAWLKKVHDHQHTKDILTLLTSYS